MEWGINFSHSFPSVDRTTGEEMTDPKQPQVDPTSADDVLEEMEESPDTDSSANDPDEDEEELDEEDIEEEDEKVN
jgi:hypothetical protein